MTVTPRVEREIVYRTVPGFRPLVLDLHLPHTDRPAPLVLFVHGGGWMMGTRRTFCFLPDAVTFDRLVAEGFAVAAIDYRLSGEATFPAPLDDVRAAWEWLRSHADEWNLDTTRAAIWGESAGATLGALLALEPHAGLVAAIDWFGPTDLATVPEAPTPAGPPSREERLLGAPLASSPDLARRASPLFRIHPCAPAFHIAHGDADAAVPVAQSRAFHDALRAEGVSSELLVVAGAGHIWSGLNDVTTVFDPAVAFLRRALSPASASMTPHPS